MRTWFITGASLELVGTAEPPLSLSLGDTTLPIAADTYAERLAE